ncbi:MAG: reductive dehalogenase domain-containing protein [Pseudomonadota bacterium]
MWPDNEPSLLSQAELDTLHARFAESDSAAGFELTPAFEPFSQRNDIFTRAFWDDTVKNAKTDAFFASYRSQFSARRGDGFSQRDFALRNASWSVSDAFSERHAAAGERDGFQAPLSVATAVSEHAVPLREPAVESAEIKRVARLFGADLVGITEVDLRWHYAARVDTRDLSPADNALPEGLTHVIVMGHAMDRALVDTYPSALAGASTGLEYSREAAIVTQLVSYLRGLGYDAVGSMNDTALVVPYAIKAGLGEYGRNQMVLTPAYGPRVRFSKVFTSLTLAPDAPRVQGIHAYCEQCDVCARACPPKALPDGPPSEVRVNVSTLTGVRKWSANAEKCFGYWASLKSDCAICMRVCPFNRGQGLADRLWFRLATGRWRRLARWWAERRGTRARLKPVQWWRNLSEERRA